MTQEQLRDIADAARKALDAIDAIGFAIPDVDETDAAAVAEQRSYLREYNQLVAHAMTIRDWAAGYTKQSA